MPGDAVGDHFQRHQILAPLGNNDVGVALAGLYIQFVHGLDGLLILHKHRFQRPAPLVHIPLDAPAQADIRIRIHENANVHQIPQGFVFENQNALHNNYLGGGNAGGFVAAVVNGEIIHRAIDGLSVAQLIQLIHHKLRVKSGGLVVVEQTALLVGQLVVPFIVVIVADNGGHISEFLYQILHQGGFAAAAAAGNADHQNISHSYPSNS